MQSSIKQYLAYSKTKISTIHFKEKEGVLASLTLSGANPRTSPKRRASRHDYNLQSWKTDQRRRKLRL